jgi:hypothetical protein
MPPPSEDVSVVAVFPEHSTSAMPIGGKARSAYTHATRAARTPAPDAVLLRVRVRRRHPFGSHSAAAPHAGSAPGRRRLACVMRARAGLQLKPRA